MLSERTYSRIKDMVLFLAGTLGIGYQTVTGKVDPLLLVVFTAMAGVPGFTHSIALIRNGVTGQSSSQQVSPSQELVSRNLSTVSDEPTTKPIEP